MSVVYKVQPLTDIDIIKPQRGGMFIELFPFIKGSFLRWLDYLFKASERRYVFRNYEGEGFRALEERHKFLIKSNL